MKMRVLENYNKLIYNHNLPLSEKITSILEEAMVKTMKIAPIQSIMRGYIIGKRWIAQQLL